MTNMSTQNRTRCTSQRVAHRDYCRQRSRQIAYGQWHPWTDAAPVRDHIRQLRQAGASYHAIADAAQVSPSTVRNVMTGCGRSLSCPGNFGGLFLPDADYATRVPGSM
jgi:hypothetical protein